MFRRFIAPIYSKAQATKTAIMCFLLAFENMLLRRRLTFDGVWSEETFVIEGTAIELAWQIRGCHKIKILDNIVVPGNKDSVRLYLQSPPESIKLIFYGIRKTIERTISVIPLKTNIAALPKPRVSISMPLQILELPLATAESLAANPSISLETPVKTTFHKFNFELPTFSCEDHFENLEA